MPRSSFTMFARFLGGLAFGVIVGRAVVPRPPSDIVAFVLACGAIVALFAATIEGDREARRLSRELLRANTASRPTGRIYATEEEYEALLAHLGALRHGASVDQFRPHDAIPPTEGA